MRTFRVATPGSRNGPLPPFASSPSRCAAAASMAAVEAPGLRLPSETDAEEAASNECPRKPHFRDACCGVCASDKLSLASRSSTVELTRTRRRTALLDCANAEVASSSPVSEVTTGLAEGVGAEPVSLFRDIKRNLRRRPPSADRGSGCGCGSSALALSMLVLEGSSAAASSPRRKPLGHVSDRRMARCCQPSPTVSASAKLGCWRSVALAVLDQTFRSLGLAADTQPVMRHGSARARASMADEAGPFKRADDARGPGCAAA
mmetsp:Transcript_71261/g.204445  ORF Transcript_71261/g.204445 Transcript_71261/m.204445 type:complete len:262 (-) Transcript_71261:3-788(-)